MGKLHLSFEELSALFDGELSAQADTSARQHLRECPQCSADYSLSVRLERDLRQPPVLSCDSALELLSASFDDQASQPERAVAERHLTSCEVCRGEVQLWGTVGYVLRTLNEAANTILVLDAVQKRVTEIDAATNMVIGATTVDVTGTPTAINVDNSGKILVTSVSAPAASAAPGGTVTVLDSTTKQLEVVRDIDVAPRMVVVDPLSNQAVLVSPSITKLVDSSYKVIATLPGGVAAAFSRRGDGVAVLSPTGADTTITFAGAFAPSALKLTGSPRAITALKEGGYLVLLQLDGQGRVVKISPDGRAEGSISIAVAGGDLLFDESTNLFTVANGGTVATGQVPATAASASSAPPTVATTTLSSPVASSSVAPTASPTTSPQPSRSPNPSAVVVASAAPDVLDSAKPIAAGLYSASLPSGLKPHLIAASGSRIWFIDDTSHVGTFDMNTGEVKTIGRLRSDAHVAFWVAGRSFVFGIDDATGQVHVMNTMTESVDSYPTNVLSPVAAVAVGPDDRLWIALRDASY